MVRRHWIPAIIAYYSLVSSTLIVINKVVVHNLPVSTEWVEPHAASKPRALSKGHPLRPKGPLAQGVFLEMSLYRIQGMPLHRDTCLGPNSCNIMFMRMVIIRRGSHGTTP